MNQGNQNVSHLSPVTNPPTPATSGGDNGNGHGPRWREWDARLREVEKSVVEINVKLDHLATREDIASMKVNFIKWAVGTAVSITIVVVAVVSSLFQ